MPQKLTESYFGGFSLIELAVVMGITAIMAVVALSFFYTRKSRLDLDSTTKQVVATLRQAQSRAVAQEGGTIWGVHFANTTTSPFYALFYTSYSAPNVVGSWPLPSDVSYATSSLARGSTLDVTFSQISGLPSTSTSVTLNLATGGGTASASSTITISSTGSVSF